MTPWYTPGKNATAVFHALADLFMVHEIPATPIGVCGRHRCFLVVTLVGANNAPKIVHRYVPERGGLLGSNRVFTSRSHYKILSKLNKICWK